MPARPAFTHRVVSEGDRAHAADTARDLWGLDGGGRKICALSDGVDALAYSQATGELPAVDVLAGQAGGGDEGTAMLEIVHDLAPGAALGFATAFGGVARFAQNILDLAASGCQVIVDDVIYLVESPFEDGDIAASGGRGQPPRGCSTSPRPATKGISPTALRAPGRGISSPVPRCRRCPGSSSTTSAAVRSRTWC